MDVTTTSAVCAGLAGLALFWAVRPPRGSIHRVGGARPRASGRRAVDRLVAGRPDAAPLARRLLISTGAGAAVCWSVALVDGGPGRWGWAVFPLLALGGTLGLGWLEPAATRRRQQVLVLQVPQALELLAACLSAGMPVRSACRAVAAAFDGPVAEDLDRVLAVTELGVSDAEAWRTLTDHPQLGPAAGDLARSVESGTMVVEGLRHHAAVARDRRRAVLQVRARAVGVRSVLPLMTCFIPSFLLLGVVPTVAAALANALHLGF